MPMWLSLKTLKKASLLKTYQKEVVTQYLVLMTIMMMQMYS